MTRPPRPKYSSDARNYHELRKPSDVHIFSLPEELLEKYTTLKKALGPKKSHQDSDGDIDKDTLSNDGESQGSDEDIALDLGAVACDSEEDDPEISCYSNSQVKSNVETTLTSYLDAT
ncbi:hypothetical protein R1sor_015396 [Riccia sorocarpa]|uniref:Uncharacterized protein n=1 Tax=Riccia sorocarpa TaxID=122646 RepID=A0ABD3HC42_9MARC